MSTTGLRRLGLLLGYAAAVVTIAWLGLAAASSPESSAPQSTMVSFGDGRATTSLRQLDLPSETGRPLRTDRYVCAPQERVDVEFAEHALNGVLAFGEPFEAVPIGEEIDWSMNPFDDRNWQWRLHNLAWVRNMLGVAELTGSEEMLGAASRLMEHWVDHNPIGDPPSDLSWDGHTTALRAGWFACAAVMLGDAPWLRRTLEQHGELLADPSFYQGDWNHGLDQNRGLLAVGCVLDRPEWIELAEHRIASNVREIVDGQGVTNEQAVGYARYNYNVYSQLVDQLSACDRATPDLLDRRELIPEFLAHATMPDGTYVPIGDTERRPADEIEGTPAEYAASLGERGSPPDDRVVVYDRGYVFGRSGWGEDRPFEDESFYALRFGPKRQIHGHRDHMSIYWYSQGRPILVEGGFGGYGQDDDYRFHTRIEHAHNVVVTDDAGRFVWEAHTELVASGSNGADNYMFFDEPYAGVARTRELLIVPDALVVVRDRLSSEAHLEYRQLWHLAPDFATVSIAPDEVIGQIGDLDVGISQLRPISTVEVIVGEISPIQGWISEGLGDRRAAPVVEFSAAGRDVEFLTVIAIGSSVHPVVAVESSVSETMCILVGPGGSLATVIVDDHSLRFGSCR